MWKRHLVRHQRSAAVPLGRENCPAVLPLGPENCRSKSDQWNIWRNLAKAIQTDTTRGIGINTNQRTLVRSSNAKLHSNPTHRFTLCHVWSFVDWLIDWLCLSFVAVTIVYTSGSTGKPKGVVHTEASWLVTLNGGFQNRASILIVDFSFAPLAHTTPRRSLHLTILRGGRAVFSRGVRREINLVTRPGLNLTTGHESNLWGHQIGESDDFEFHTKALDCVTRRIPQSLGNCQTREQCTTIVFNSPTLS